MFDFVVAKHTGRRSIQFYEHIRLQCPVPDVFAHLKIQPCFQLFFVLNVIYRIYPELWRVPLNFITIARLIVIRYDFVPNPRCCSSFVIQLTNQFIDLLHKRTVFACQCKHDICINFAPKI